MRHPISPTLTASVRLAAALFAGGLALSAFPGRAAPPIIPPPPLFPPKLRTFNGAADGDDVARAVAMDHQNARVTPAPSSTQAPARTSSCGSTR